MAAPLLIYCAAGNRRFAECAVACGWLYGARLPATVYQPVFFADQDWKCPNLDAYTFAVKRHCPVMATVLDWEYETQWPEVMRWAERISSLVEKIVLIPKVPGLLGRIPKYIGKAEVVLGYSVPTSYGGSPVPLWEFGTRPVHLLGGSPQKQMDLARYMNVVSVDGNMAHQQAHRCRYWSKKRGRKGHWTQLAEADDRRAEGANLEAFRRSLLEIAEKWNGQRKTLI